MGSHGGATAEGQRELLAGYGIDEAHMGVPIVTDMDVVQIGTNSYGQPVWWDRNAFAADGVVTVARIKAHTDYRGKYESGVIKMLAIGLGKREGADQHHRFGAPGLRDIMPASAKVVVGNTKFIAGVAIVENAREETAVLRVLDRDEVFDEEPKLLEQSKQLMGRLPFSLIDCLVIGECGKNYSGTGIDPNVIGRILMEAHPDAVTNNPRITRIALLDLSPESHGNAAGIGLADLTTDRALASIDPVSFRMNSLTSRFLWRSKLPLGFETDRECIQMAVDTCWQPVQDQLKFLIIPNTLEVPEMWVSAPLAVEARNNPDVEVVGNPIELPVDAAGSLNQEKLFPHSLRARRIRSS